MQEEPIVSPSLSEESERKLWIDYLGRINDRQQRARGGSGATSWALLGVLVAILYKVIPNVSVFLSLRANVKVSLVLFLFECDIAALFLGAYATLLNFYMGATRTMFHTEQAGRFQSISHFATLFTQLVLAIAHLAAARSSVLGQGKLRWLVSGLGIVWALNFWLLARKVGRKLWRARKLKIPAPWFQASKINPKEGSLMVVALTLMLATVPVAGFFWYLSSLHREPGSILLPFAASGYAIAGSGIFIALFYKGLFTMTLISYENLERDVLLEKLSPSEIRTRFISQLMGWPAEDWLNEQTVTRKTANVALRDTVDSVATALDDLQQSDGKSPQALKDEIVRLLTRLGTARQQHLAVMQRHRFLVTELLNELKTVPESPPMTIALAQWREELNELTRVSDAFHDLATRTMELGRSISQPHTPA